MNRQPLQGSSVKELSLRSKAFWDLSEKVEEDKAGLETD